MTITESEILRRFNHHPPSPETVNKHESIRAHFRMLVRDVVDATPTCREQSLAITALEEALYWANAAIARPPAKRSDD